MSTSAFFIERKDYKDIYDGITHGYTLCYQGLGSRYYDDYIRLNSGLVYDEYFNKAVEYKARIIHNKYYGSQAFFKTEMQAKLFLEWVESRMVLNKLINE